MAASVCSSFAVSLPSTSATAAPGDTFGYERVWELFPSTGSFAFPGLFPFDSTVAFGPAVYLSCLLLTVGVAIPCFLSSRDLVLGVDLLHLLAYFAPFLLPFFFDGTSCHKRLSH